MVREQMNSRGEVEGRTEKETDRNTNVKTYGTNLG